MSEYLNNEGRILLDLYEAFLRTPSEPYLRFARGFNLPDSGDWIDAVNNLVEKDLVVWQSLPFGNYILRLTEKGKIPGELIKKFTESI